uniref:DOG1 domain-containing protein n=1 Tax=Aegilops tauschii subsp. strangulata TaxID=200361 RepID=A0A453FJV1_AEGTS
MSRARDQIAMDMARYVAFHQQWIAGQQAGLRELAEAAANAATERATDAELRAVVERCMRGYQEYAASRRAMARENGAAFVAPPWCTAFENSVLWLGGCRPSLAIRLLYSISGEGLTERLASLQENIADRPLLPIVRERAAAAAALVGQGRSAKRDDIAGRLAAAESSGGLAAEVDAAMESYSAGLARLLEEADELRMSTARALATEILTPRQAVEMLVAAKQLHLAVRDWSRRKEEGAQNARLPRAAAATTAPSG